MGLSVSVTKNAKSLLICYMTNKLCSFSFDYFHYFSLHAPAIAIFDFHPYRIAMQGCIKIGRTDQYISFLFRYDDKSHSRTGNIQFSL